jgi:hypothetical protein
MATSCFIVLRATLTGLFAVVICWNPRRFTGTDFIQGGEQLLLDLGLDYSRVSERDSDNEHMRHWFGDGLRAVRHFPHSQRLDFDGLRGRLFTRVLV